MRRSSGFFIFLAIWAPRTEGKGKGSCHLVSLDQLNTLWENHTRDKMNCTVRFGNCFLKIPLMCQPSPALDPCCQGMLGELAKSFHVTYCTVHFVFWYCTLYVLSYAVCQMVFYCKIHQSISFRSMYFLPPMHVHALSKEWKLYQVIIRKEGSRFRISSLWISFFPALSEPPPLAS